MHYGLTSGKYSCTFTQVLMPYWNVECTKAVTLHWVEVGGVMGQGPASEVTHLRLNQPPIFSSVHGAVKSG